MSSRSAKSFLLLGRPRDARSHFLLGPRRGRDIHLWLRHNPVISVQGQTATTLLLIITMKGWESPNAVPTRAEQADWRRHSGEQCAKFTDSAHRGVPIRFV